MHRHLSLFFLSLCYLYFCFFLLSLPLYSLFFISSVRAFWVLQKRQEIVTAPQGAVVILTVNYNNMSNWATQLSAVLLPQPVRNCSVEPWVETHVWVSVHVCVCVSVHVSGWRAAWLRRGILALLKCSMARSVGLLCNSWHFFICEPNRWFTLPLMACEVRSRLCNGRGNLARGVQTVHSPSLSLLLPSLPLPLRLFHSSATGWHLLCILYLCTLSSMWCSPGKMPSPIVT